MSLVGRLVHLLLLCNSVFIRPRTSEDVIDVSGSSVARKSGPHCGLISAPQASYERMMTSERRSWQVASNLCDASSGMEGLSRYLCRVHCSCSDRSTCPQTFTCQTLLSVFVGQWAVLSAKTQQTTLLLWPQTERKCSARTTVGSTPNRISLETRRAPTRSCWSNA